MTGVLGGWLALGLSIGSLGAQPDDAERRLAGRKLEAEGDWQGASREYEAAMKRDPKDWRAPMLRGQVLFRHADNARALEDFDRVVRLAPAQEPYLWQRGIAQYYAKQFEACVAQFELHRTVNPDDVENAVWHFLCLAKLSGVEKARETMLPVGPDARAPMPAIYRLYEGELEVDDVLRAAGSSASARFYAELYVGLYLEASGNALAAAEHLERAAEAAVGGYMRDVARVHLRIQNENRREGGR